jgi:hypothetical protein
MADDVTVRASPSHGKGVFAARPILHGERPRKKTMS